MGLPFQPLTATEHRARWPLATARIWDFSDSLPGDLPDWVDRPGLHRDQVLDFHDGLRLVVSLDRYADGRQVYLHVSASGHEGTRLGKALGRRRVRCEDFHALVLERIRFLCGRAPVLAFTTPAGIPHFFDPPLEPRS